MNIGNSTVFNPSIPPKTKEEGTTREAAARLADKVDSLAQGMKELDGSDFDNNPAEDVVSISLDNPALIDKKIVVGNYDQGNISATTLRGNVDATYSRTSTEDGFERSFTQIGSRYVPEKSTLTDLPGGLQKYSHHFDPDAFGHSPIVLP